MKKTHLTSSKAHGKRRTSHLYHVDTYSGGWFLRALDIAAARRNVLKTHIAGYGHVVRRATKADIKWGYPMLKP